MVAARGAIEEEKAVEDQALQESGLEGTPILVERDAEVQEGGRALLELLEAIRNRDPGHVEKVRKGEVREGLAGGRGCGV